MKTMTKAEVLEVLSGPSAQREGNFWHELAEARAAVSEVYEELERANDAAAKGELARHTAGGMELEIAELRAEVERLKRAVERKQETLTLVRIQCDIYKGIHEFDRMKPIVMEGIAYTGDPT